MMTKSFSTLLLLAALVLLSAVAAQETTTTTTTTTTTIATTSPTTAASQASTTSGATKTTGTGGAFTTPPNFSSLGSVIASYATGRSNNPGNTPTSHPNSAMGGAFLMHESSRSTVLTGLALVLVTALMAAMGTVF